MLNLTDLCHPGQLSSLRNVPCDLEALDVAVDRGALQLTLSKGYLLLRREGEAVTVEFKGQQDSAATKVRVLAADVAKKLNQIKEQSLVGTAG